jgi:SAM-dependent methyltransferase
MASTPAIVVVLTAPRPTSNTPSLPFAGAIGSGEVTIGNYIIGVSMPWSLWRLPWFRESNIEPMVVTMSAVRTGERLLQVGVDDPVHVGAIAGKVGIGGDAVLTLPDDPAASRIQVAVRREGVIDTHVGPLQSLSGADASFDVVVIHSVGGLLTRMNRDQRSAMLRECHRVLRPRGRLVAIEAGPAEGGLGALFGTRREDPYVAAGGAVGDIEAAGFRPVRILGERDNYRFIEGARP